MAATKYLKENQHKRTIGDDADRLEQLDPFVGGLTLKQVHMGSLQPFIEKRRNDGVKTRTVAIALALARRILNLAASEWRNEKGLTWLEHAPKITLPADKWEQEHGELAPMDSGERGRMTSSTHSVAASGRPACHSRIGRTCLATRAGGLRRTTRRPS
jgi:hypothetical protein